MKPAEPVTRTFTNELLVSVLSETALGPPGGELIGREPTPEREGVPPKVRREPLGDLEVRGAEGAVEPDRRNLGHRLAQPAGLGGELQADLKAGPAVDADGAEELRRVGLEAVRGVPRTHPREDP